MFCWAVNCLSLTEHKYVPHLRKRLLNYGDVVYLNINSRSYAHTHSFVSLQPLRKLNFFHTFLNFLQKVLIWIIEHSGWCLHWLKEVCRHDTLLSSLNLSTMWPRACVYVECADPESVVIRGPGHWRSLMTGLWPVLAFVCLECSTPLQGFFPAGTACWPLAACLGWRGGWSRRYSRLDASWSPIFSLFHSPPLLPEPPAPWKTFWLLATIAFVSTSRVNSTLSLPV